jgi:hypothetical protein
MIELTIVSFLMLFNPSNQVGKEITIEVDDCGPLGRGSLGVVFSLKPHGSGKSYFAEGKASVVCPKLTTAIKVVGYEEDYCLKHKPLYIDECSYRKVFVITEYIFAKDR